MTKFRAHTEVDIVTIKEEIATSLRSFPSPEDPDDNVWSFLRVISRSMEPVPLAIRKAIQAEVEERICRLSYGDLIELCLQTDIGWSSDDQLADYIAESAARRDVIHQLIDEMINWAGVEVHKEENPDWERDVLK